ncbi:hypothetical protein ACQEU3_26975 [Spirillospora sp. CA-253888]
MAADPIPTPSHTVMRVVEFPDPFFDTLRGEFAETVTVGWGSPGTSPENPHVFRRRAWSWRVQMGEGAEVVYIHLNLPDDLPEDASEETVLALVAPLRDPVRRVLEAEPRLRRELAEGMLFLAVEWTTEAAAMNEADEDDDWEPDDSGQVVVVRTAEDFYERISLSVLDLNEDHRTGSLHYYDDGIFGGHDLYLGFELAADGAVAKLDAGIQG